MQMSFIILPLRVCVRKRKNRRRVFSGAVCFYAPVVPGLPREGLPVTGFVRPAL